LSIESGSRDEFKLQLLLEDPVKPFLHIAGDLFAGALGLLLFDQLVNY